jgi:hypothetical protein
MNYDFIYLQLKDELRFDLKLAYKNSEHARCENLFRHEPTFLLVKYGE